MPRTSRRILSRVVSPAVLLLTLQILASRPAQAQTTGTLVGMVTDAATANPVAGATIIATSHNLQGEQVATTGADGSWRLAFLPPGPYQVRVVAAGYVDTDRSDLFLKTDRTLKVAMALAPATVVLDEQVVTVRTVRPAVDPTSAQTGIVLPELVVDALPLPASPSVATPGTRSFEMAALAAPGAESDPLGVGMFGGASSENRYIVSGLDVTNPNTGANLTPLLLDFIQEVDVKAGNYMPKYGRASGGIVSAVTKSGSNELHGSVFSTVTPRWLFQPDGEFSGTDGQAFWTRDRNSRGAYDVDLGFEVGGPVVRDRLWFHVGFAPVLSREIVERQLRANVLPDGEGACPAGATEDGGFCRDADGAAVQEVLPSASRRWAENSRSWQYTGKMTWLATPEHTFTLSALGTPYSRESVNANTAEYRRYLDEDANVASATATWTGRFFSRRLLVEALAGWLMEDYRVGHRSAGPFDAGAAPVKYWFGPGFSPIALGLLEQVPVECEGLSDRCLTADYATGGENGNEFETRRLSARLSASYLFSAPSIGSHVAEVGIDLERSHYRFTGHRAGAAYYNMIVLPSGAVRAGGVARGSAVTDPVTGAVTPLWNESVSVEPVLFTPALYLQDQWQPHPSVTLNAGVRVEWQSMYDRLRRDAVELEIRDAIAPRLQAIWDPGGRGRSKIAGGWGRFYEAPPLGLADTAHRAQFQARYSCPESTQPGNGALDPRSECPLIENSFGDSSYLDWGFGQFPVAPSIDATFVDHFVVAAEHDLWRDISIGIEYQGRRLGTVVEDMSGTGSEWYIANPGVSGPFEFNGEVLDGRTLPYVDPMTGKEYSIPVRRPQRSYDGLTFKVTKLAARGLFGQASYTLSSLRGDYAGRLVSEAEQFLMPGQTVEYDFAEALFNRRGPLPGDRTHALRAYGGYRWHANDRLALTFGTGVSAHSGTPVDVRSMVAREDQIGYGGELGYIVPRGRGGRTPWLTNVDLRAQVDYVLRAPWAFRFTLDAFNVLDAHTATAVDEVYSRDQVAGILGASCSGNPASASNPASAVAAACPDLAYAKTVDGRPVTVNRNWGRPTEHQIPFYLRFGAALTF